MKVLMFIKSTATPNLDAVTGRQGGEGAPGLFVPNPECFVVELLRLR